MKYIIAILTPAKFDEVKDALIGIGVYGITVIEVKGFGRQKGHTETYRGSSYTVDFIHRLQVEMVVEDENTSKVLDLIVQHGNTGDVGAGKIFVLNTEEAVRIRDNVRGVAAL